MTTIILETAIHAPLEICFNLARSVDAHLQSMKETNEIAVAGRKAGLCELGDTITWEATHFGIRQRLSVRITKMQPPQFFEDRMLAGAFKSMRHEHWFEFADGHTLMIDKFMYEVPFGVVGELFDSMILKRYMTNLLKKRNEVLKKKAETKNDVPFR